MVKLTTEQFIEKARAVHGDRYDYSKSVYGGSQIKVEIVCKEHGSFWQRPLHHQRGIGCPKCGDVSVSHKLRKSLEELFWISEKYMETTMIIQGWFILLR